MAKFNVLGASERNLQAINLVLNSPRYKLTAGQANPDMNFKEQEEIQQEDFTHPFKLSIVTDEGDFYLDIVEGSIQICSDSNSVTYVNFNGLDALDLSELDQDDEYLVILTIKYDGEFGYNVYFVTSPSDTAKVPAVRGFQTIILGKIKRETDDNDRVHFSVIRQDVTSDLFLTANIFHPFSITAKSDQFTDGSLKDDYSLSDFTFNVNGGNVIIQDSVQYAQSRELTINSDTYVYCSIQKSNLSAYINPQSQQIPFNDQTAYNHLIGFIEFGDNGLVINQFVFQQIEAGSDNYKVKTISGDNQPDYLSSKFIFQQPSENYPLNTYSTTFIGGDLDESQVTAPGLSGNQYKIKPIWLYKNIPNYATNHIQYLKNVNGSLSWVRQGLSLAGSLSNWEELHNDSDGTVLRWKPEYNGSAFNQAFYFMASVKNSLTKSVLSGISFGTSQYEKDAVMIWDRSTGLPAISTPPPSTNVHDKYFLAGEKETGIFWSTAAGEDTYQVKVDISDPSAGFLQEKLSSENESILIDTITDNDNYKRVNLDINPEYFYSSDDSIAIEETQNGLDFTAQLSGDLLNQLFNAFGALLNIPPTGVYIPIAISGQLRWFPISGFGPIVFKEEYSETLSSTIYDVNVVQTPTSGEYVFTNYNPETSAYFEWVGVDDCDIECPDDVQTEQRWEEDLRRLIWI